MRLRAIGRRRAATAVEFATVSLLFFSLLLAAVELTRALMVDHLLKNTARQACREGVPSGRATADIKAAAATALSRSALSVSQATVVVKVNGTEAEAASAKSGDRITVDVTVPLKSFSWVPGTRYVNATLGGSYTLRRE